MPPPTASQKPNKAAAKDSAASKAPAPAAASNGTSAATGSAEKHSTLTKPDQAKYNAEQDQINKEISELKVKQDAIKSRIALSQAPGGNDRRSQIKAEMDSLRGEQGNFKSTRQKTFDEMKRLQENVQKKIKDAQASRGKLGFKSVAEVDQRIESLNSQVESGQMKLVDEKKALQEISNLKRSRRTLEASGSVDDAISADKARIDELKKLLDDPEAKKVSDRFDELKKEMDGLRDEGNKAYEERNKLFDQRTDINKQMDELYGRKRDSAAKHREANDQYYAKVAEQRQARQDRYKSEKAKEDAARREEDITRMREEAKAPAYQAEIEDTSVLIGWFKGKYGGGEVPTTNAAKSSSNPLEGVKEHEIRQVDSDFKGMTLKKKGEDEELGGFFGGGGKSKKKGGKKAATPAAASGSQTPLSTEAAGGAVNLPMSLLTALLSLGIPPPSGKDDVSRVISDLETKKAWFEANSAQKTKAEIERVEKLVAKMERKNKTGDDTNEDALADADEGEAGGAREPNHTAAVAGSVAGLENGVTSEADHLLPVDASPTEEVKHVDSALEEVKEQEAEAKA